MEKHGQPGPNCSNPAPVLQSILLNRTVKAMLYYGRCGHRHGYNLVNMVEPAWNFEPEHIEKLINLGNAGYQKNPNRGHVAE